MIDYKFYESHISSGGKKAEEEGRSEQSTVAGAVWGHCDKGQLLRLLHGQKRSARTALKVDFSAPSVRLLRKL